MIQKAFIQFLPYNIGFVASLLLEAFLYSFYCFEFKWGTTTNFNIDIMLAFYEYYFGYFMGYGLIFTLILRVSNNILYTTLAFSMTLPVFMVISRDKSPRTSQFFGIMDNTSKHDDNTTQNIDQNTANNPALESFFTIFCKKVQNDEIKYKLSHILYLPYKITEYLRCRFFINIVD